MKLSTRARYGTRALIVLACNYDRKPVLLKDIAKDQDISERYLENIMTILVTHGLVRSTRGKKGGFALVKSPAEITMYDAVKILEGSLSSVSCVGNPKSCKRLGACAAHDLWEKVDAALRSALESLTLADLAEMQKKKQAGSGRQMYYI